MVFNRPPRIRYVIYGAVDRASKVNPELVYVIEIKGGEGEGSVETAGKLIRIALNTCFATRLLERGLFVRFVL